MIREGLLREIAGISEKIARSSSEIELVALNTQLSRLKGSLENLDDIKIKIEETEDYANFFFNKKEKQPKQMDVIDFIKTEKFSPIDSEPSKAIDPKNVH